MVKTELKTERILTNEFWRICWPVEQIIDYMYQDIKKEQQNIIILVQISENKDLQYIIRGLILM